MHAFRLHIPSLIQLIIARAHQTLHLVALLSASFVSVANSKAEHVTALT